MIWIPSTSPETGWTSEQDEIWSKYDLGGDYDGLLLSSSDIDSTYDGGAFEQNLWSNASQVETSWSTS